MVLAEPLRLTSSPDASSVARAYAAQQLAGAAPAVVSDVQLVLTELVTNAQLHGKPPLEVEVRREGAGAYVAVHDAGRDRLVLPAPSDDAMTGRGLSMVAALAVSWGVEPLVAGGKRVWAVVQPGGSLEAEPPDIDVEALLQAWPDEPLEPEYTVRLGSVPTVLLLEAKRHIDNVVRELTFVRAAATAPLPPEVQTLVETVTGGFARARARIKEQAAEAAARGEAQTELVLTLPASSIAAGERYLAALDEVDRYAREALLLTLETPPLHRLFRRWYVTALIEQLRSRASGEAPAEATPFVEVLLREVGELSALRGTAHRLDLLQRVNAAIATTQSGEAMARTVLVSALQELGAVTARMYVHDAGVLRSVAQDVATLGSQRGYDSLRVDADLPGSIVFRTGQSMTIRNLADLARRFPKLAGVYDSERALHVVPVTAGNHRLGVLALGFPPSSMYDDAAQTAYVRALADALAQGLERLQVVPGAAAPISDTKTGALEGAAHLSVSGPSGQRLKSLADAAAAIAGARSVEALLEVVSEAARAIIGTHQAVATRLYDGTWRHASTHVTLSDDYSQWRTYDQVPEGLGVLNAVTRENRPVRLNAQQLRVHPEFRDLRDAPGHPPLPDYLGAPLVSRDGRNIGLIQLAHKQDGTDFDEADEAIAVQLALMVSAALEHVEMAEELEKTLSQLRAEQEIVNALNEVGRAVTSHLEHEHVVQVVTDAATTMVSAQFGAFFYNVIGDGGGSSTLYATSGVPREAFRRLPFPRETETFAPIFDGGGVVRLEDVTVDAPRGRSEMFLGLPQGDLPVRSYLAVPVRLSTGELVGGLFFGHGDPAVFDEQAERLAVGIAGYAAIALENGRLYDSARRESLAKEVVAAALEQPLQPPDLPTIPGVHLAAVFQPLGGSGRLGGDFYDAFPLSGGRWMLAIGDVAGKGPEAAALTGLVRYTLWGAAQYADDPAAVAVAVNAAMLRQQTERFATLVIAVLTPQDEGLGIEAVWAGHPPALLVSPGRVQTVSGRGMPVGMFADLELEPVRFVVRAGETLLLHTDGLLEREATVLDEGALIEQVVSHADLPVDEALALLVESINQRHPARDDVAAMMLRLASPSA